MKNPNYLLNSRYRPIFSNDKPINYNENGEEVRRANSTFFNGR